MTHLAYGHDLWQDNELTLVNTQGIDQNQDFSNTLLLNAAHKWDKPRSKPCFEHKANKSNVAEPHTIPVPNDTQLEELAQLHIRAAERAQWSESILATFVHATHHADVAISSIENATSS